MVLGFFYACEVSEMKSVDRDTVEIMLVREETCPKISSRASGLLGYRVCIAADEKEVFLGITSNETSGYFSRELVPLSRIEQVMADAMASVKAFPASRLKSAFEGRSVNNASFLAAILRNEGLVVAALDSPLLNMPGKPFKAWKKEMGALPRTVIEVEVAAPVPADPPAMEEPTKGKGKKKASKKLVDDEAESGPQWEEAQSEVAPEGTEAIQEEVQDAVPQESK